MNTNNGAQTIICKTGWGEISDGITFGVKPGSIGDKPWPWDVREYAIQEQNDSG